ncbi:Avirulence protein (Avh) [Phytophthora palmivora]|uniref:RxLR effector protein n=1 Tax=Phytophthora palmivora TaxID=4796 RepID=A0A2P4X8U3_9STRA|nr:Avirulence protein (Avh) [Phytophthora palmivora]
MRQFHILVVIGATFLASSGVYSTITDSNQVETSKVASPSDSNLRLLRTHHTNVDSEERGLLKPSDEEILAKLAKKLKINPKDYHAQFDPNYLVYMEKLNALIEMRKLEASLNKALGIS